MLLGEESGWGELLGPEQTWQGIILAPIPTFSAGEMLTNAALDAPYAAGLANGWSSFGSPTLAEETIIVHTPAGSSQKLTVTATAKAVYQSPALVLHTWYALSGWVYVTAGSAHFIRSDVKLGLLTSASSSAAAWTQLHGTARCIAAGGAGPWFQSPGGAATFYVDDASMRPLTRSSLVSGRGRVFDFTNGIFSVGVTRLLATQAGICLYADANNWVLIYLDGAGNIQTDQMLAGVFTPKDTTAIVYGAGQILSVQRSGYGASQTYKVSYNGVLKVTVATITDAIFDTARNWFLFSTYAGNSFGTVTWTGPH